MIGLEFCILIMAPSGESRTMHSSLILFIKLGKKILTSSLYVIQTMLLKTFCIILKYCCELVVISMKYFVHVLNYIIKTFTF